MRSIGTQALLPSPGRNSLLKISPTAVPSTLAPGPPPGWRVWIAAPGSDAGAPASPATASSRSCTADRSSPANAGATRLAVPPPGPSRAAAFMPNGSVNSATSSSRSCAASPLARAARDRYAIERV